MVAIFATYSNAQSSFGSASFGLPEPLDPVVTRITSDQVDFDIFIPESGGADLLNWTVWFDTDNPPTDVLINNSLRGFRFPYESFAAASGLSPSTTYRYYMCATNSEGTVCTTVRTVTTLSSGETPSVTTVSATSITTTTATLNGDVTADGGSTVSERGFYWSTSSNPTSGGSSGSGTGTYSLAISSLTPATTYYYRAYAVNADGVALGAVKSFATSTPVTAPIVSTTIATGVTTTSASSGGTINYNGGSAVTERGVVYGTSTNPTISGDKVVAGSGDGSFSAFIDDLTANTTYYYRAYGTNITGTGYGTEYSFTTVTDGQIPTVSLDYAAIYNYTNISATGSIISNGGRTISDKGIIISTGTPSYPSDAESFGSGGSDGWTNIVSGLAASTTYYFKMYAVNSVGTGLSSQGSLTTPSCDDPIVLSLIPSDITTTSINITTNVNSSRQITQRRIHYSSTGVATESDPYVSQENVSGSIETTISGLSSGTCYYFSCYAYNECGSGELQATTCYSTYNCTGAAKTATFSRGEATNDNEIDIFLPAASSGWIRIVHVVSRNSNDVFTFPAGWTKISASSPVVGYAVSQAIYYQKLTTGELASYITVTTTENSDKLATVHSFSNATGVAHGGGNWSSSSKATTSTVSGITGSSCDLHFASLITLTALTATIDYGTDWCCGFSGYTFNANGWGYSNQLYKFETAGTSTSTSFDFTSSYYGMYHIRIY